MTPAEAFRSSILRLEVELVWPRVMRARQDRSKQVTLASTPLPTSSCSPPPPPLSLPCNALLAGEHFRSLSERKHNRPPIQLRGPDSGAGRVIKFSELPQLGFEHSYLREDMLLQHNSLSYEFEFQEFLIDLGLLWIADALPEGSTVNWVRVAGAGKRL